jgi:hypothetical protein
LGDGVYVKQLGFIGGLPGLAEVRHGAFAELEELFGLGDVVAEALVLSTTGLALFESELLFLAELLARGEELPPEEDGFLALLGALALAFSDGLAVAIPEGKIKADTSADLAVAVIASESRTEAQVGVLASDFGLQFLFASVVSGELTEDFGRVSECVRRGNADGGGNAMQAREIETEAQ